MLIEKMGVWGVFFASTFLTVGGNVIVMKRVKVITKKWIIIQALVGIVFLVLCYKYIDTTWIKWPLMIMIAGAFYYSTKEDLNEMFKDKLLDELDEDNK